MTQNNQITVTLTSKCRLKQALKQAGVENPATVTQLTIAGTVTDDDFTYIRKNMGMSLQELDMGAASIQSDNRPPGIPPCAFSDCSGLTSVVLPLSIHTIGGDAFENCTGLKTINIPDSVVYINKMVFRNCISLKSIIIPDSVIRLDTHSFTGCSGMTSINIPKSVTEITYNFDWLYRSRNNASIRISDSLTEINIHPDNPAWASENGILFNKLKTKLICYPQGRKGDYAIPDSVVEIGDDAFKDCTGLTSVIFPNSLLKIGNGAFEGCTGLTSVSIPYTLTEIEDNAFKGVNIIFSVDKDNPVYKSNDSNTDLQLKNA
jgi:hypothetical protein